MRFDDRLLTVLSQPAGDRHDAAVRWRQLVDLVARAGPDAGSPVVAQALEAIRANAPTIDEELRAAAARAVAGRPLPIGLLEYLVSDRLSVAAPVLAAAALEPAQWRALIEIADEETRQFILALHPDAAPFLAAPREPAADRSPQPTAVPEPTALPEPAPESAPEAAPPISEAVARIERRRRRETERSATIAEVADEPPSLFRWECGPSGEIAWVDGAPRGALIGRSLARTSNDDSVDDEVVRAFARRAPFRDADLRVSGEGLVAGGWKISGLPAFDPTDGRFAGYRGIALRDSSPPPARRDTALDVVADPDSLRELVHEIKTPLNAIIGFAEIIQGQYLGPADQRYRERAGEIVEQARLLVSAIDDLDFAAKIHSSTASPPRVDLTGLLEAARDALTGAAARRGVEFELVTRGGECVGVIEPEIAERLIGRLVLAVIERAEAGEYLRMSVERGDGDCRVAISRPAALRNLPDALLFGGAGEQDAAPAKADLSAEFLLRLVRGLARIAGGDLLASPASLTLVFPRA